MWNPLGPRRQHQGQEDLIARLCRESGRWTVVSRQVDIYRLRAANDHKRVQYIQIRYSPHCSSLVLQSFFPVRFSLENPPSGLFGRLLLRNFDLIFAAWGMQIVESCEAGLYVAARLSPKGIDAGLFDAVCRELVDEIHSFGEELSSKFRYGVSGVVPGRVPGGYTAPSGPEVVFIEPVQHHIGQIGQHGRYRLTDRSG